MPHPGLFCTPRHRLFRLKKFSSQPALLRVRAMNKGIHTKVDRATSLSLSNQILFVTDVEGHFKFVNAAAANLAGYSCEELQTLDVFDLLPSRSKEDLSKNFRRALRRRFGTVFEIAVTTRSGRCVVLETSIAVVRKRDRAIEFRGVAIELGDERQSPRCLDENFPRRGGLDVACWLKIR